MSRTAHFGIGLGILVLCVIWGFFCFVYFIGNAIARDSVPGASVYDSSFIILYVVGGAGFLVGLWCAFLSFRRALRPPRLDLPTQAPALPTSPEPLQNLATADERLAHLVKKTES